MTKNKFSRAMIDIGPGGGVAAAFFFLVLVLPAAPRYDVARLRATANAQTPLQQVDRKDDRVIINTDLVSLTVTVTDKQGHFIAGLDKGAFTVFDDKVPQEISHFSNQDAPLSVGVVFDLSGSMSGDKINQSKAALARFIQTSHEQDEYCLIGFNEGAHLLLEGARDGEAMLEKLARAQPHGNTAVYDAVAFSTEQVSRCRYPRRALIVISDGEDNRSRQSFGQLRRRLREADVTIYTIRIGASLPRSIGRIILDELATASGGKAFSPKSAEETDEAFEQIALELRRQYSIGFLPSQLVPDGRWHRLQVRVTPPAGYPRVVVRNREGYYADIKHTPTAER